MTRFSSIAALVLVVWGCLDDKQVYVPSEHESETKPADYVLSSYEAFPTEVTELSSLCFTPAKDGFYAVSDGGPIYEIGFDGATKKVLYNDEQHDFEGVDTDGTNIYVMDETESAIYTVADQNITKLASIVIPGGGASGKGPEGLMYGRDTLYVGNQDLPKRIVKYCVSSGKTSEKYLDLNFVSRFISDLHYDTTDDTMWIIDSKGPAFYHSTLDGKLLATYHIDFVKQAEALVIDHERSCAWIGCDVSAKLYKVPIEF